MCPDSQKAVHHQDLESEAESSCDHPAKIATVSPVDRISVQSKDRKDRPIKDAGREVSTVRFPHPPLGIPFCASNTGEASRSLPLASSSEVFADCSNTGFRRGVTGLCQCTNGTE